MLIDVDVVNSKAFLIDFTIVGDVSKGRIVSVTIFVVAKSVEICSDVLVT